MPRLKKPEPATVMLKKQAHKFFKWYCHPDYYEDIQGDLEELYLDALEGNSFRKAEWFYTKEVLLLFRPTIIRPISFWGVQYTKDMFQNYLKIGFRNLAKHQLYTLIHILGLALGLAAFLLINQYTNFEKSYDNFHEKPTQLHRLTTDNVVNGVINVRDAMTFAPAGKALQEDLPEVLSATTTFKQRRMVFRKEGQPVEENGVIAVDSNFLNLFNYKLIAGNKEELFSEPYSMVLTQKQVKKYFGNNNPLGQTIEVLGNFNRPFKVTGVLADIPENVHYKFDVLLSLNSYQERVRQDGWNGFNYYTYLRLSEHADLTQIAPKLPALSKKYLGDDAKLVFHIQPVKDIHLQSDFTYEPEIHGSARSTYFLDIISVFILLIAWINYINLSTARATERAKEVGLRKVVGAQKSQLMGQFFTESFLINIFGAIVAIGIAQLALPYFNELVGKTILMEVWQEGDFLKKLGLFCLLGTLVTGIYPSLVLSSFKPIGVLKGAFTRTKQGVLLRKGLVVFQFAASLILIAATVIVYQQIRYMTNVDLGINTEKVIGFNNAFLPDLSDEEYESKYYAFLAEIERQNGITDVASISAQPGGGGSEIASYSGGTKIIGHTEVIESTIYRNRMNDQLIDALDIQLVVGRNFDRERAEDTTSVIINMAFLKLMGISEPNEVIGEYLQYGRTSEGDKVKIVGVIKDYNRSSLKTTVEPTIFSHEMVNTKTLVRLSGDDLSAQIDNIESVWNQFYPNAPLNYAFLDDRFEKLYKEDKKFGFLFGNFAVLAVIVAILGLFGLASYLSLQRTKEVGIRKVLGASTTNIIFLFFKDFIGLILIAVLIGIPLIYWSMNDWLNGYAYRINFPWWVILMAMILVTLLAFITVSWQTFKIAALNPAQTIKQE